MFGYRIIRRRVTLKGKRSDYVLHREEARSLVHARVAHYAGVYRVKVRKVFIKNSKTRWGSCSKNGNLNFHYKIIKLPEHLANYLVVHEICHLLEFNHSAQFWAHVAQEIPDYGAVRKEIRNI